MNKSEENPVPSALAAKTLGVSSSTISALKRSMNIKSRKVFVSDLRKFLRAHPQWTSTLIYHRSKCVCAECLQKRAAKVAAKKAKAQSPPPPSPNPDTAVSDVPATALTEPAAQDVGSGSQVPALLSMPGSDFPTAPSQQIPPAPSEGPTDSEVANGFELPTRYRGKVRSGLGQKLRFLRGDRSAKLVADRVGLSRESIFRIESGKPVKLTTVRAIAGALGAKNGEMLELIKEWCLQVTGDDAKGLRIETVEPGIADYADRTDEQSSAINALAAQLSLAERDQLIKALQYRDIVKSILKVTSLIDPSQISKPAGKA